MSDARPHIVFAEPYDATVLSRAEEVGRVTVLDRCDEESLVGGVRDADALLVRSTARVTKTVIDHAEKLRVIGRGGVGIERIDVSAARARGITVVFTPAASTDAVADLTVGLMIALLRRIVDGDAGVRCGEFGAVRKHSIGPELHGLTLGVIGLGRIGRAVARRCRHGFGMRVLYNDIVSPGHLGFTATSVGKEQLCGEADVVSLHVPLTPSTRRMIDREALALFKANAVLINTSRGAVMDGEALANALHNQSLGGAALDVFDPEPLPEGHPLLVAPRTVLTPHLGARTPESLARMNGVVEDVLRVLEGKEPQFPATLDDDTVGASA